MNRKYWLIGSAILMILIGIMRAGGGIALLMKGNQLDTDVPIIATNIQITMVGIGLLIIGLLFVVAAINLIKKYSYNSWVLCWIVLVLFFLGGLLNGFLLFGHALDQGQKINIVAILLTGIPLFLGKSSLKPKQ
jgi:hypothetical protein